MTPAQRIHKKRLKRKRKLWARCKATGSVVNEMLRKQMLVKETAVFTNPYFKELPKKKEGVFSRAMNKMKNIWKPQV